MSSSSKKARLAVFASGKGSNYHQILTSISNGELNAEVVMLVSDRMDSGALDLAQIRGDTACFVNPRLFDSREYYEKELLRILDPERIDLVILAGFMRVLSPVFVRAYEGRILNIHPSLLPSFPGLNAVRKALEAGVEESGCTVHYVDEGVDTGPIILQRKVPVELGDTEETLHRKIQLQEYEAYPEAIRIVLKEKFNE